MSGVDILSFEEVVTETALNEVATSIVVSVTLLIAIIIGITSAIYYSDVCEFFGMLIIGVILSLIFGSVTSIITKVPSEHKTQYKVTISDEVSLNEFNDRYEIIDQEGKIYTVREK